MKKPVSHLLREMGLKDLEISKNLEHSDFFYFNEPLLTTSLNSNNRYYDLIYIIHIKISLNSHGFLIHVIIA